MDEYGPVIDTIYDFAQAQGLKIDTVIQEGGAGQIEINLLHGDPLALADQVFFFKRTIREAALKNDIYATFMAKPMRDEPGSAMHIHQSVLDTKTGESVFSDVDGNATDAFMYFIGGSQKYLMQAVPLLAPYVNSYRRITVDAQSAPASLEWAADNRTTGLRVLHSAPAAFCACCPPIGKPCDWEVVPQLTSRVMPVSTQIMATEPLTDEMANDLLPTDTCVEDIRYILDYYRLSAV